MSLREFDQFKGFEILYKIVGTGTHRMADLKAGTRADFLGPFGHGYRIRENREHWLVGGGIGIPPLLFLAEELKKKGIPETKVKIFFGSRTAEELYCLKDFEKIEYPLIITTDDNSRGEGGFITNPITRMLDEYKETGNLMPVMYACGPEGLLHMLTRASELYDMEVQISMEMRMGCGLGICQGCVVKTIDGYKRVCKDGPVFNADEIDWEALCG